MKVKDAIEAGAQLTFVPDLSQEAKLREWSKAAYAALSTARDALAIQGYTPRVQRSWQTAYDVLRAAEEEL